jgi:hypothetical protein
MNDILIDAIDRLRAEGIDIPESVAWKVESALRADFGGAPVYVHRVSPNLPQMIAAERQAGQGLKRIAEKFGLSLNTARKYARLA